MVALDGANPLDLATMSADLSDVEPEVVPLSIGGEALKCPGCGSYMLILQNWRTHRAECRELRARSRDR